MSKTTKTTFVFLFISLILISSVFAQRSNSKNKINFKSLFEASKQINYRIIDQKSFIKNYYNNDEIRTGLNAGVFGKYQLNDKVFLQSEITISKIKASAFKDWLNSYFNLRIVAYIAEA